MTDIKAEKQKIRKEIKKLFKKLIPSDYDLKSEKVLKKLTTLPEWRNAETVLVFLSLPDEIKTDSIINRALIENKKTAVPRIDNNDIIFHFINSAYTDFSIHSFGMAEPDPSAPLFNPESADDKTLVLVPGLAFDNNGFRLGRGKGFYDRFLSSLNSSANIIGIGYDFQIIEFVPVEKHDFPLDLIITDM